MIGDLENHADLAVPHFSPVQNNNPIPRGLDETIFDGHASWAHMLPSGQIFPLKSCSSPTGL